MAIKVIDASAACAIVFAEAEGARLAGHISGHELIAPAVIEYEVANTCLNKIRLGLERRADLIGGLNLFLRLPIDLKPTNLESAMSIAERHGLSFYDAAYLSLAQEYGSELVTLDQKLACAAVTDSN